MTAYELRSSDWSSDVCSSDLGETIEEFGGHEAYGVAENYDVIESEGLLPMGLALGATLRHSVPKDQVLSFADVSLPSGRLADALYAEQRSYFAEPSASSGAKDDLSRNPPWECLAIGRAHV